MAKSSTTKIPVGAIVYDESVYPRGHVDGQNVSYMAEAMESGTTFPPVVIEKGTNRLADGRHRCKAFSKLYGEGAKIDAIVKVYDTDGDLFLDAVRLNAHHGCKLSRHDRAHIAIAAESLKIDPKYVANALNMRLDAFTSLSIDRRATLNKNGMQPIALKRTILHKRGQMLTERQADANRKLSGMSQMFYVNQVITLIEAELLDDQNEELMKRLAELGGLIAELKL